jgi:two-component system alkaline phosphatase synthesis response regulator PhoP
VLTREQLLDLAWPVDVALEMETSRNVDVMIRRVRMKLGDSGKPIETVHGHGYKLRDG